MAQLTPDQMNALINYAARQLGMSPADLEKTVRSGHTDQLAAKLGTDTQTVERLMQSPQAKAILQQLLGGE